MKPTILRSKKKSLPILVATALGWTSPGHCAPMRPAWWWADVRSDPGMDLVLLWLTAIFWVVTHVCALLIVWSEARAASR